MDLARLPVLAVLLVALYVGWCFLRGRSGHVPLYIVSLVVAVSLPGGAVAQLSGLTGAVETFNMACLSLSLAALASTPSLWEDQIRLDFEHTRLYQSVAARDLLSWKAWLKVVDRMGARQACLGYLCIFIVGILGQLLVWNMTQPELELYVAIALLAPLAFAVLSAVWVYRGVRRVVPGS